HRPMRELPLRTALFYVLYFTLSSLSFFQRLLSTRMMPLYCKLFKSGSGSFVTGRWAGTNKNQPFLILSANINGDECFVYLFKGIMRNKVSTRQTVPFRHQTPYRCGRPGKPDRSISKLAFQGVTL